MHTDALRLVVVNSCFKAVPVTLVAPNGHTEIKVVLCPGWAAFVKRDPLVKIRSQLRQIQTGAYVEVKLALPLVVFTVSPAAAHAPVEVLAPTTMVH